MMNNIKKLIRERDQFLEDNPELLYLQIEIDETMENMDQIQRCQYLSNLMSYYLTDIEVECRLLLETLEE